MSDLAAEPESVDVRWLLKSATSVSHKALEASVPLMKAEFNHADYVKWIKTLYGFYSPAEQSLSEYMPFLFNDWQRRIKRPWLVTDLQMLGATDDDIMGLPVFDAMPEIASKAQALGVCYVLEGATLGGQVINRHLHKQLGIDAQRGGLFYHGYGEQTGPMWKAFELTLRQHADTPALAAEAVNMADLTFKCFSNWIKNS